MKRIVILLSMLLVFISINANSFSIDATDSLKIDSLQREVSILKSAVSRLQQEDERLRDMYQEQAADFDSLRDLQQQQAENIKTLADKVGADISDAHQKIDNNASALSSSINTRTWLGVFGILIAITLLGITYYILRRKINSGASTIDKIKSAQDGLEVVQKAMQEESVKLDNKLVDLLDKQLSQQETKEENHLLVKSIATEVARIEQNLAFMDSNIKGVSNLKNRASAIKSTMQSKGYDIPSLIGESYHEGDTMKVTMELDEELPIGTHIIRRVMKPMILYQGKLIQAAEVVVAYNE